MHDDRRVRIALRVAIVLWCVAFMVAAIVPGRAWSPGSPQLADADVLATSRVVHTETGLALTPMANGAMMVATGDGGGAGPIEGIARPPRVRAASFRGVPCWEIGAPDAPSTYVNDNGVRLDDTMSDRLRVRGWPVSAIFVALACVTMAIARGRPRLVRLAPALWLASALVLVMSL